MSKQDIIAQIDAAVGCQQCQRPLKPNGPSPDFCGEACQEAWHARRHRTPILGFAGDRVWVDDVDLAEMADRLGVDTERVARAFGVPRVVQFAEAAGFEFDDWQRRYLESVYLPVPAVPARPCFLVNGF